MSAPVIRAMTAADIDGVLRVEQASFSDPWTRGMFADECKNALAWYLVAECEGQIAGYCGIWFVADEGHITNVAVHPAFRRRGLARALLRALLAACMQRDLTLATLEVRAGNEPAQALYRAYGFREVGRRKAYYRDNHEDALLMTTFFKEE